jgi:hypothetical protein
MTTIFKTNVNASTIAHTLAYEPFAANQLFSTTHNTKE